ncbi:hypothetical protein HID58_039599 [Brassica napus]|uniref:Uncharacterized protein n=1 Tax=Brassica napus TaxID=3708 RepID=A0ABQ8BSH8_BRANA|nr:hypothetical protein HID58_039599 [Brassica napus]
MSRKPCCVGEGLKKGAWTTEEDKKLISYIHEHGEGGWRDIPQKAGLKRCGKSCRLRWANYLKPDIKRGEFSYEEEQIIIMLHASRGNNPNPATTRTSEGQDDSNPSNLDEQSQSGSMSPKYLPISSSSCNLQKMSNSDETTRNNGSLSSKKCRFKKSSSTSKLLNKVATKASSIGNMVSASVEGSLIRSTILSPCLNDVFSETSQFQMDEFDPFSHSSEQHITDHMKEDINMDFDLKNSEFDFSQFIEQFSNIEAEKANAIGGYNQDLLLSDVSSTSVDEDNIMQNITGWSNYLVDDSDFPYDTNQDFDDKNFI